MKEFTTSLILAWLPVSYAFSQNTHEIKAEGFNFSPSSISVNAGDTVFFNSGSFHPLLQVDQETWNSNGSGALDGGFDFPDGLGKVVFDVAGTYYFIFPSHISSGMKGTITVNSITGIQENETKFGQVILYPNPFNEYININFRSDKSGSISIMLIDGSGRTIREYHEIKYNQGINNFRFLTGSLAPGIYTLDVKGESFRHVTAVIK
ncbi:MAG: T9SS type A sorting domain-containing protein [Bacteroidales bacterium]|nr:T9SS type A sorting domain-containing protein [Bacteroidales bacterium]